MKRRRLLQKPPKLLIAARILLCEAVFLSAALAALLLPARPALTAPPGTGAAAVSRGQMLYETHCIACHTTHVHWRDQRLATNWDSLIHQVSRWQDNTHLSWNAEDVAAVSAYLNRLYYHFPTGKGGREIGQGDPAPSSSAPRSSQQPAPRALSDAASH